MWFEDLMGFVEETPDEVRKCCYLEGGFLISKINNQKFQLGEFETPNLKQLRTVSQSFDRGGQISVSEVVGDVKGFHQHKENQGALFQVASQFNLLEVIGPHVSPEHGVGIYEYDGTQGPACAIACGAGTIFRNYLVPVRSQIGQTKEIQIDCLEQVGNSLGNVNGSLWTMRNGYALPSEAGLKAIAQKLNQLDEQELDVIRGELKVGIHWNTQVTLNGCEHVVSQIYGSALPVAYSGLPTSLWAPFARLILDASYEATLRAAIINRHQTGNRNVFLTLLGGGAFGNLSDWIFSAIRRAITIVETCDLEVKIVSYGASRAEVVNLCKEFS